MVSDETTTYDPEDAQCTATNQCIYADVGLPTQKVVTTHSIQSGLSFEQDRQLGRYHDVPARTSPFKVTSSVIWREAARWIRASCPRIEFAWARASWDRERDVGTCSV